MSRFYKVFGACFSLLLLLSLYPILFSSCHNQQQGKFPGSTQQMQHQLDSLYEFSFRVPPDSSMAIQRRICKVAQKYNLTKNQVAAYCRMGYITGQTQMNFLQGKALVDSAARLVEQTGKKELWPLVYLYYSSLHKYNDTSLYYIEKVMPHISTLMPLDQVFALNVIGNNYSIRSAERVGNLYYLLALRLAQRLNPRHFKTEIALYDCLATNYLIARDTAQSMYYHRIAYQLCTDSIVKNGGIEYFLGNLAQMYIDRGYPDSAVPIIKKYATIVKQNYAPPMQALPNIYWAGVAAKKKQYQKADSLLAPFGKAIDTIDIISPQMPGYWFVAKYYGILFWLKKEQGDLKAALEVGQKWKDFEVDNGQKKTNEELIQYEKSLEKTKADIAKANQEKLYAQDRLMFYLLLLLLLLLLTLSVSLVIFFRSKKREGERRLISLQQAALIEKKDLLLQAETAERRRIAQELHDELGGALIVIKMAAQNLQRLQNKAIEQPVEILQRNSKKLTAQINEIVWSLNDNNNTLENLLAYIYRYAKQFLADTGISHTIDIPPVPGNFVIDGYKRRYIFHSVKESLTNIAKHSKATAVVIVIKTIQDQLVINIDDNGSGLPDASLLAKGNGMDNIRKNITALGGTVNWLNQEGTKIMITIPLKEIEITIQKR